MAIKTLPARLANQIAAGEVVERPSSVIKELVENSLDAGATNIHIQLERGGSKLIRIRDNGSGISKDDLTLALSRHATSKISSVEDLENILSLGFRGEALASISSVSRLKLTSKPADQEEAWLAYAEGRDMNVTIEPAAHPDGTTIEVSDLFFNTPARRKFLRTDKTEFHHIDEMLKRIALSRFDVAFQLEHNQKSVRRLRACDNQEQREQRVAQLCSRHFMQNALQVSANHHGIHLSGWIAHPDSCKQQNDVQYSFVNGRMMRDKLLNHAIRQAYNEFIPDECHPAFILYLTIDAHQVDVNVHPAKHEVRFHQGRLVHDFVVQAIESAFAQLQARHTTYDTAHDTLLSPENNNLTQIEQPQALYASSNTPAHYSPQAAEPARTEDCQSNSAFTLESSTSETRFPTSQQRDPSTSAHDRVVQQSTSGTDYPGQHSRLQFTGQSHLPDKPSKAQLKQYDRSLQQFSQQRPTAEHQSTFSSTSDAPSESSLVIDPAPSSSGDMLSTEPMMTGNIVAGKKAPLVEGIKVVAVLQGTLAIAVCDDQLWQIDIAALDANQLLQQAKQTSLKPQPLLLPVRISLKNDDKEQLQRVMEPLAQLGVEMQVFSQHLIVKKVPAFIRKTDVTLWFDALFTEDLISIDDTQILIHLLQKMLQVRDTTTYSIETAVILLQRAITPLNAQNESQHTLSLKLLHQHATKIALTT